jgi:hypothetical protein
LFILVEILAYSSQLEYWLIHPSWSTGLFIPVEVLAYSPQLKYWLIHPT